MSSSRVLLAWEQGRHLGHLTRLAAMDALIKARQGESVWVVPQAHLTHPWVEMGGGARHPAPVLRARKPFAPVGAFAQRRPSSFADILLAQGFSDPQAVTVAVKQWLKLFEAVAPVSVLCDYAPVAQLAACLAHIPTTQLTNGFDAPPVELPAFDEQLRGRVDDHARRQGIERLAETIHQVGRNFGVELDIARFFGWPRKLSDVIPETDPYGERPDFTYVGPFTLGAEAAAPRWPESKGRSSKRAYAYLRGGMGRVGPVLEALRAMGVATCCVWPDATDAALGTYSGTCIGISRSPVNLAAALEQADLVVNYGSGSVVCSAVLAGKAQLMMPMDQEKLMFARRVEHHGAGITWMPHLGAAASSVERVLGDESLAAAANAIAKRHLPEDLTRMHGSTVEMLANQIYS